MKYHTLLSRQPNEPWAIEFGDYDKDVVKDEAMDFLDSNEGHLIKVITTQEDQASIQKRVDLENDILTIEF